VNEINFKSGLEHKTSIDVDPRLQRLLFKDDMGIAYFSFSFQSTTQIQHIIDKLTDLKHTINCLNNMEDEMEGTWDKYDPKKEPR